MTEFQLTGSKSPLAPKNHRYGEPFLLILLGVTVYYILCLASYNVGDNSPFSASFPKTTDGNLGGKIGSLFLPSRYFG